MKKLVWLFLLGMAFGQSTPKYQLNLPVYGSTGWNLKLNTNFSWIDAFLAAPVLQAQTTARVLVLSDSNTVFTNTGAAAEVDYTLPACSVNAVSGNSLSTAPRFVFEVDSVQAVKVSASGGAQIRYVNLLSAVNGNVNSANPGAFIELQCIGTSSNDSVPEWVVTKIIGTWSLN